MEPVRPSALHTVAKMADAVVYAVAAGGVIAGGLLFRDDQLGFAVLTWSLTLVAGAGLRVAAWALKALAQLMLRTERLVEDVADLRAGPRGAGSAPGSVPPLEQLALTRNCGSSEARDEFQYLQLAMRQHRPSGHEHEEKHVNRRLEDAVGTGWAQALDPVRTQISTMGDFLRAELQEGRSFLPAPDRVLAAFANPFDQVRVLIVGQDPYPTDGHPIGLSFSVASDVRPLPKSLENIYREYTDDLGYPMPSNGDLTPWSRQGVMLLNRSLTVRPGAPASHRGKGWEPVTEQAIRALVDREQALVAILWGADARSLKPMLGETPVVESPHPSPLSAHRGFFGSRPFSRSNQLLTELGAGPIDWRLP